jgi:hypothetical protein
MRQPHAKAKAAAMGGERLTAGQRTHALLMHEAGRESLAPRMLWSHDATRSATGCRLPLGQAKRAPAALPLATYGARVERVGLYSCSCDCCDR